VLLVMPVMLAGCEYACGIGLLVAEYRAEEREKEQRLEQCGECPEGERCNLLLDPARCRPAQGAEGDPCGAWKDRLELEDRFVCPEPLVCNQALEPDVCAKPGPVGTPCYQSGHCSAQAWCDGETCVATLPIGAACDDDEACRPNTCLDASLTCGPLRPLGGACSSAQDCVYGLACSDEGRCYEYVTE
jgi:hypothetical protein